MRIVTVFLAVLFFSSSVYAYSNIGLIKSPRSLSYFSLYSSDNSSLSSGLVYTQKQNDRMALEVNYTAYKSLYLLTKNITKIRVDEKYKLVQFGPVGLTVLGGCALLYSPAVGAGLAGDVGGILAVNIVEGLAASAALNIIIYNDGVEMGLSPNINYRLGFLPDSEIYGGARVEAQMVGSFGNEGGSSGKVNFYLELGYRAGL